MRILVVGGTGFIGETLCEELHRRDHDVTALARNPGAAALPAGVDTAEGDVTAYDSIEAEVAGQDAVVNLVALSPLFRPSGGNEAHFAVHRDGTENVVRAAEAHDLERLVQMSALGADPEGDTAYVRSKGQAEAVVRDSSLEWTIFRPSVVFGDGGEFLPYTKRLAPPYLTPLPGGGKTRFQPIWVGDIVPMLADALEGLAQGGAEDSTDGEAGEESTPADRSGGDGPGGNPHAGEVYEVAGPEVLTLAEVATLAHAADGKPVGVVSVPMPLAKIGLSALDHIPVGLLDALPGVPRMGSDQYRSLQFDNTTDGNDVEAFGVAPSDMRTVADYVDVDPESPGS